jgi:hypothetical protein
VKIAAFISNMEVLKRGYYDLRKTLELSTPQEMMKVGIIGRYFFHKVFVTLSW